MKNSEYMSKNGGYKFKTRLQLPKDMQRYIVKK